MTIDYKKLLPSTLRENRWGEFIEAIQTVLGTIKTNKVDIIETQYQIEHMTTTQIEAMRDWFGYQYLSYEDGWTSNTEYLKRQILTVVPRILKRNNRDAYKYLFYIFNLIADIYPMYWEEHLQLLYVMASWWAFDESAEVIANLLDAGDDNILYYDGATPIYDTPAVSPFTDHYLDTDEWPTLDLQAIRDKLTRHFIIPYRFRYIDDANNFMSENTLKAFFEDVKLTKRKTEVPYFEPICYVNTPGPAVSGVIQNYSWQDGGSLSSSLWFGSAFGNGTFVAGGVFGNPSLNRSTDYGITWDISTGQDNIPYAEIAFGNDVFIAVSNGVTGKIAKSTDDGLTWVMVDMDSDTYTGVEFGNETFVAVNQSGTKRVTRSLDYGSTWTSVTASEDNAWTAIAFGNNTFVAVSKDGTNRIMRSTDNGATWTSITAPENNQWYDITFGNGVFVAVSIDGTNRIMRSGDNGVTWESIAAPENNQWSNVTFGNDIFYAVSIDGTNRLMKSTDNGATWVSETPPTTDAWAVIEFGNGVFMGISSTNKSMYYRTARREAYYDYNNTISGVVESIYYGSSLTTSNGLSGISFVEFGTGEHEITGTPVSGVATPIVVSGVPAGRLDISDMSGIATTTNFNMRRNISQKCTWATYSEVALLDAGSGVVLYSKFPNIRYLEDESKFYGNPQLDISLV